MASCAEDKLVLDVVTGSTNSQQNTVCLDGDLLIGTSHEDLRFLKRQRHKIASGHELLKLFLASRTGWLAILVCAGDLSFGLNE